MTTPWDDAEYQLRQGQRASVYLTRRAIFLVSMSGRGLLLLDDACHFILDVRADNSALGNALLKTLAGSRFLTNEAVKAFLKAREDRWQHWLDIMCRATGLNNAGRLLNQSAVCGVSNVQGTLTFSPNAKRRGAAWEGLGKEFDREICANSGPETIGRELRDALARCFPKVPQSMPGQ